MGRSTQTLVVLLIAFTALIGVLTIADAGGVPLLSSATLPTSLPTIGVAPTDAAPVPSATPYVVPPSATPTTPAPATATNIPNTATPTSAPTASPTSSVTIGATPVPSATAGTGATATSVATSTIGPRATVTASVGAIASPVATTTSVTTTTAHGGLAIATAATGVVGSGSPPHYGLYYNYINNTPYLATYVQTLDQHIIALTNVQRGAHGLSALVESNTLDIIAASRAQDMIARGYFSHYDPTGSAASNGQHAAAVQELLARNNVPYTEVGENLVNQSGGYAFNEGTPAEVVNAFMQHPEHRANILYPAYTAIGVGMALRQETDGLRVVIAQVFVR